jgi:hypothetical protein
LRSRSRDRLYPAGIPGTMLVGDEIGVKQITLVMDSWCEMLDGKPGSAIYLRDSFSYAACIKPWTKARYACSWREIRFQELRMGDHFRLIGGLHPTSTQHDGKTVFVAGGPPYTTGGDAHRWNTLLYGDPGIHVAAGYPGKGAGFDWYDLEWPYSMHSLQPIAASNPRSPRTFPYGFGRDDKGYAIIKEGTH